MTYRITPRQWLAVDIAASVLAMLVIAFGLRAWHGPRFVTPTAGVAVASVAASLPATGTVRLVAPGATVHFTNLEVDGVALSDVTTGDQAVAVASIDPAHARVTLTATRSAGSEGFVVELGAAAPGSFLSVRLGGWQNRSTVVVRHDDGYDNDDTPVLPWTGLSTGIPVRLRVELDGERVRVWVDDELRHDYLQSLAPEERVVVGALSRTSDDGAVEYVTRVVNATADARSTRIELPVGPVPVVGSLHLLAGAEQPDLGRPGESSPVDVLTTEVEGFGGVHLSLPPWSCATVVVWAKVAPQ